MENEINKGVGKILKLKKKAIIPLKSYKVILLQ